MRGAGAFAVAFAVASALGGCTTAAQKPGYEGPRAPHAGSTPGVDPTFPLKVGTSFDYHGVVRWATDGAEHEQDVDWRSEVVEVIDRGPVVAYVMKGFPADLVWSEGEAVRGDWVVIAARRARYYATRATPQLVEALRSAKDVEGLIEPEDLILALPLRDGGRTCKREDDPMHCWTVEALDGGSWRLTYRTNPDTTVIDFTPGVGIVGYAYMHHGTVSEVVLRLRP